MRLVAAILWRVGCGLILGCGSAVAEDVPVPMSVPLPRPRPPLWAEPRSFLEAAGPDFNSAEVTTEPSDCRKRLDVIAAISPMPRLIGPGACGGGDMVQLDAVLIPGHERVALKPAPVLRCVMAEQLAAWIRDEAAPRVAAAGTALRSVETYDDFDCRGRNRILGAKLSEHGKGNAVDLRTFTLADRQVIGLTDMTAPKDLREAIRASACARFTTVLGPGSDGYHEGHIHLDLAERSRGYRICQWEVREPPPPAEIASAKVPLPTPRPSIPGDPAPAQKL